IKSLADDASRKRSAALLVAENAFKDATFPAVGAEVWRELWEAARHYSRHIERRFPAAEGEHCVLCHQPLGPDASARLNDFEAFVRDDTEMQADAAEKAFAEALRNFRKHQPDIRLIADMRRRIAVQHAEVAADVLRFLASADLRRL
ncbi:DNA repair protein, partial [Agrobacterium sp. MCAB5]